MKKVWCVGGTPYYDTKWNIKLTINGKPHIILGLIRHYDETPQKLIKAVEKYSTYAEIKKLDRENTIWYD